MAPKRLYWMASQDLFGFVDLIGFDDLDSRDHEYALVRTFTPGVRRLCKSNRRTTGAAIAAALTAGWRPAAPIVPRVK